MVRITCSQHFGENHLQVKFKIHRLEEPGNPINVKQLVPVEQVGISSSLFRFPELDPELDPGLDPELKLLQSSSSSSSLLR